LENICVMGFVKRLRTEAKPEAKKND